MTPPTILMPPAIALACATLWKLSCVCLKWLAHASIAAPAAAAAFPPFPDPQHPEQKPPTTLQPATRAAVLANWPGSPSLIRLCDEMADRGASLARDGRPFNAFTLIAIPDDAQIAGANDIALLAWAARLGWREGEAVKLEARR